MYLLANSPDVWIFKINPKPAHSFINGFVVPPSIYTMSEICMRCQEIKNYPEDWPRTGELMHKYGGGGDGDLGYIFLRSKCYATWVTNRSVVDQTRYFIFKNGSSASQQRGLPGDPTESHTSAI